MPAKLFGCILSGAMPGFLWRNLQESFTGDGEALDGNSVFIHRKLPTVHQFLSISNRFQIKLQNAIYIYMGVNPKIGGKTPQWMVKIMEKPIKMGRFGGTVIFGNTHI